MQAYDIYNQDGRTAIARGIGIDRAAAIAGIDPEDIGWAIDEAGRCDTDTHTIVEAGDPAPGPMPAP